MGRGIRSEKHARWLRGDQWDKVGSELVAGSAAEGKGVWNSRFRIWCRRALMCLCRIPGETSRLDPLTVNELQLASDVRIHDITECTRAIAYLLLPLYSL